MSRVLSLWWSRSMMLAALCGALGGVPASRAAEPHPTPGGDGRGDGVPRLETTSAREAQAAWMGVKGIANPAIQLEAIGKKRLESKVCDDLVDLRALSQAGALPGFDFRDNVRGRSWARPTLALVLSEAMKRFQRELPQRTITIGDVSQPGCGQVAHGVLVQDVTGEAARRLLDEATLELSERVVVETKRARDFPWESDRFGPPDERVRVTTRLLGKEGAGDALVVRVARTRHRELAAPTKEEVAAFEAQVGRLVKGTRVAARPVESRAADGSTTRRWWSHWVIEGARQQLVLITSERPGKRLEWQHVVEARVASWQDKKPGSFPDEVRWVVERVAAPPPALDKKGKPMKAAPVPIGALSFSRWALMYEAGHITHLSGIDADLSYVTVGDQKHFAVDLPAMDVPATLRWMEIVAETGRDLGTPVDAILVDASVKRHFEKTLPKAGAGSLAGVKKGKAWRLLTLVGGHDAHHHLRIVEATPAQERAALKRLQGK